MTDRSRFADRNGSVAAQDEGARASRETETREAATRPKAWSPPNLLPEPNPQDGWKFRWLRASSGGRADASNMSKRFREGWVVCKASDHPEISIMSDKNAQFPDGVEVGGLVLCKIPAELVEQRAKHYARASLAQTEAVNNTWLAGANPLMKKEILEQTTTVSPRLK